MVSPLTALSHSNSGDGVGDGVGTGVRFWSQQLIMTPSGVGQQSPVSERASHAAWALQDDDGVVGAGVGDAGAGAQPHSGQTSFAESP